jgi:hypothetical protein
VISWQRSGSSTDLFTAFSRGSTQEQQRVSDFLAEECFSWQKSGSSTDLFTPYTKGSMQEQQRVSDFVAEESAQISRPHQRFHAEQRQVNDFVVEEWELHRSLHLLLQRFHAGTAASK